MAGLGWGELPPDLEIELGEAAGEDEFSVDLWRCLMFCGAVGAVAVAFIFPKTVKIRYTAKDG